MSPDEPSFMSSDDEGNMSDFASPENSKKKSSGRSIENTPPPCGKKFWKDVPPSNFSIRGKTYKKDKKKVRRFPGAKREATCS
jgi:hypothetical protein